MPAPKLGDIVLYDPPEDHSIQTTIVGVVVKVEDFKTPDDEEGCKISLWCFPPEKDGATGWATPEGYSKEAKPDHWRWPDWRKDDKDED
jgi:hypothetical protein